MSGVNEDEGFTSFDLQHSSSFAGGAFHSQGYLFGCFGFLVENRLGLSSETRLFHVITSSSLRASTFLSFLQLGHFVVSVFFAFLAMSLSGFKNADLVLLYLP
mgnify:CR=1 FL=1